MSLLTAALREILVVAEACTKFCLGIVNRTQKDMSC